ncbi:uncharacterized protein TNCV_4476181 [Trichonephila clavipes]|nr:uncharacterized protein TNCV_4476181 [Trichonephila clavipes]
MFLNRFRSIPTSLWPPPAKKSAPCACSEPWVHYRENFTKQNATPRYGGTPNSRRASIPLGRLVEWEDSWEACDQPQSVLPLNWGGTEPNCMGLKATANDRRHLAQCFSNFQHW